MCALAECRGVPEQGTSPRLLPTSWLSPHPVDWGGAILFWSLWGATGSEMRCINAVRSSSNGEINRSVAQELFCVALLVFQGYSFPYEAWARGGFPQFRWPPDFSDALSMWGSNPGSGLRRSWAWPNGVNPSSYTPLSYRYQSAWVHISVITMLLVLMVIS